MTSNEIRYDIVGVECNRVNIVPTRASILSFRGNIYTWGLKSSRAANKFGEETDEKSIKEDDDEVDIA